jgi:GT2 family glycosyltransferase
MAGEKKSEMDLSVIIISHGHEAMLHNCLRSFAPALRGLGAQTILLDNLPSGGAERQLRPVFQDVVFVNNESPVGLSENMNRAARIATGEYLLFLNPDTEFLSGSLTGALDYLERHTDAALLSCRLLNEDGSIQQNYRRFPTLPVIFSRALGADHWPWHPWFYRSRMMINVTFDRPTLVDWVFGAFMLIRKDDFAAVGGMDPGFVLYYEDVDLCYRLRERGLRTVYFPDLQVAHRHMRSSARAPFGRAWRWHLRSAFRILRKHHYLLRPPVERQAG